jgi:hypothetical protein
LRELAPGEAISLLDLQQSLANSLAPERLAEVAGMVEALSIDGLVAVAADGLRLA